MLHVVEATEATEKRDEETVARVAKQKDLSGNQKDCCMRSS